MGMREEALTRHRGVCFGNQLIGTLTPFSFSFPGRSSADGIIPAWRVNPKNVAPGQKREYGETAMAIHKVNSHADRLFEGLGDSLNGPYASFMHALLVQVDFVHI